MCVSSIRVPFIIDGGTSGRLFAIGRDSRCIGRRSMAESQRGLVSVTRHFFKESACPQSTESHSGLGQLFEKKSGRLD